MNIDELLESERHRPGFTKEARAAMWQGIERSVSLTVAASGAAPAATGAAAAGKLATWKLGALLSAAALGGAGIGAAAHARWGEPRIVHVEHQAPPVIATVPPPIVAPAETPPIAAAPSASTAPRVNVRSAQTPPSVSPPASGAPKDPSLARERTLLDMARTALSRGDASAALASLDAHAREFPSSQLAAEREVLAIQALASENRMPEARRRAAAFRASYPASPLLPIIDEATQ